YPLPLHDALPIWLPGRSCFWPLVIARAHAFQHLLRHGPRPLLFLPPNRITPNKFADIFTVPLLAGDHLVEQFHRVMIELKVEGPAFTHVALWEPHRESFRKKMRLQRGGSLKNTHSPKPHV